MFVTSPSGNVYIYLLLFFFWTALHLLGGGGVFALHRCIYYIQTSRWFGRQLCREDIVVEIQILTNRIACSPSEMPWNE